jgi:phytoene dehydrogenase-like protein
MALDYQEAVVVGSGPNGLAAAITLQRAGIPTLLLERNSSIGGGMRTAEITLPGFKHDICSAIHPLAPVSPFFLRIPKQQLGVEYIDPPVLAAHPFDDAEAAVLLRSVDETATLLGEDSRRYQKMIGDLVPLWGLFGEDLLGPIRVPRHPMVLSRFGVKALLPASALVRQYRTERARGLLAGMAAHSMRPLHAVASSAVAIVLALAGHIGGWPMARGGSQSIADALARYFLSLGGRIETNRELESLEELPARCVVLLDVAPKQLLKIADRRLSRSYRATLERFRYGPGVFKLDLAIDGPVPFNDEFCRQAGTVHLGGSFEEVAQSEYDANRGCINESPFVLLAQQSLFDRSRSPEGKHTVWAYCHTPNGSTVDRTEHIERQIERFAPGFRDRILARHAMSSADLQIYDPNYVGGDINGGAMDLMQIFARPVLKSPYRTSIPNVYLCSASTPPGGGVHGQCGYQAAQSALQDHFPDLVEKGGFSYEEALNRSRK